jgi:hypothetical protein
MAFHSTQWMTRPRLAWPPAFAFNIALITAILKVNATGGNLHLRLWTVEQRVRNI